MKKIATICFLGLSVSLGVLFFVFSQVQPEYVGCSTLSTMTECQAYPRCTWEDPLFECTRGDTNCDTPTQGCFDRV